MADNPTMSESVPKTWEWPAAVIMERMAIVNRWADERWETRGIVRDTEASGASSRMLMQTEKLTQTLYPGHVIRLYRDEAEGYFYNILSPEPKVFVLWRMEEDVAIPKFLSVSYHEGSRWLDSGENVDGVALPPELAPWMAEFVALHYQPEEKKPRKYASNKDKGRMGNYE
jgi:hypothetical protein